MKRPNRRTWRPILEPGAGVAWAVIHEIAAALRREGPGSADGPMSVAGGAAGEAIFFAYLDEAIPDAGHRQQAERLLDRAIQAVSERPMMPGFYGGFSGIAWAAQHLLGRWGESGEDDGEDGSGAIDEALLRHLQQSPWRGDYDLVGGLVGLGIYALERLPRPSAVQCLELVIERLAELAEPRDGGLTIRTAPELLIEPTRREYPQGYYNLGVAHGVPGAVALLGAACAAGVATERARPLLAGLVDWMLRRELVAPSRSAFPTAVVPGVQGNPSRAAWCYGDPGIVVTLLGAARAVGETRWEAEALRLARAAARRPDDECGVVDAGLCHGAAGLALLYNRLYQATGEAVFAEAARAWCERTITLRRPGAGVGGYLAWGPTPGGASGDTAWIAERGLLTGAAGVGLALLAAASPIEPRWDLMLLTSISPERAR